MNKIIYISFITINIFIKFDIFAQNVSKICDFNYDVNTININDFFYQTINYDIVIHEHKGFDSLNQKPDTLQISENLISIKKPSFIKVINDEADFYYSILYCTIQIFYENREIFFKDSVLTAGTYYLDEKNNILLIPLIMEQYDDLFTSTSLFYCNLQNNETKVIALNLSNASSAITICDGKKIIFNSSDKLYVHDVKTNKNDKIVEFDNPFIRIYKIEIMDDFILLFYINNYPNDLLNYPLILNIAKIPTKMI